MRSLKNKSNPRKKPKRQKQRTPGPLKPLRPNRTRRREVPKRPGPQKTRQRKRRAKFISILQASISITEKMRDRSILRVFTSPAAKAASILILAGFTSIQRIVPKQRKEITLMGLPNPL